MLCPSACLFVASFITFFFFFWKIARAPWANNNQRQKCVIIIYIVLLNFFPGRSCRRLPFIPFGIFNKLREETVIIYFALICHWVFVDIYYHHRRRALSHNNDDVTFFCSVLFKGATGRKNRYFTGLDFYFTICVY